MNFTEIITKTDGKTPITNKVPNKVLNICLDAGSTMTRSIMFKTEDIQKGVMNPELLVTDTATVQLNRPLPSIRTQKVIQDNLECVLTTATNTWRIVKGSMRQLLTKESVRMVSSISKLDQETTYQSILFQCGLNALCDSIQSDTVADVYNINLTLALPPEDTVDVRKDKITSRLLGVSTVEFPRLNKKINLNILSVDIYAEPIAAAYYYSINQTSATDENIVFLDCGGRSKGAVLTKNGRLVLDGTVTGIGGGERFVQEVAQNIATRLEVNLPNMEVVRAALETGSMNIGTQVFDVTADIDLAKEVLAEDCADVIRRLLDKTGTKLEEIQRVVCTGRTFKPSVKNGTIVSKSLVEFIEEDFQYSGVPIGFERYSADNPIVHGLYYYAMFSAV